MFTLTHLCSQKCPQAAHVNAYSLFTLLHLLWRKDKSSNSSHARLPTTATPTSWEFPYATVCMLEALRSASEWPDVVRRLLSRPHARALVCRSRLKQLQTLHMVLDYMRVFCSSVCLRMYLVCVCVCICSVYVLSRQNIARAVAFHARIYASWATCRNSP